MRAPAMMIIAASLGIWAAASAGCDVDLPDSATAAAAAVSVGVGGAASGGAGGCAECVNGCTRADAEDMTGAETSVTITDIEPWVVPHQVCIVVDAGDSVVWQSVTAEHPLVGGESPITDDASPITAGSAEGDVTIAFPDAGEFPYFCEVHIGSMKGVVYVE